MAMATGTRIMAMPTQPTRIQPTRITATPTGHTVITATAGDQALASVSDVAGVGATEPVSCSCLEEHSVVRMVESLSAAEIGDTSRAALAAAISSQLRGARSSLRSGFLFATSST